ncbi:MAG: hypothetical protein DWQ07_17010 [Chloroflexi bacterium]|nr:MAG: hypothetical protein DWQ07_17010 [Chloroflexota bacterium]MBL1195105.1 hypothetical protein [Chloroflexota bacterium]NOH12391.1 hypothetical protein [Chloroflexota bacterium]
MTTDLNTQPVPQPTFSDRLATAFIRLAKFLARLLFVVGVAAALGVGLYLGIPRLYQDYIQPVEDHTLQIADISARQEGIAATLDEDLLSFQDRIGNLEVQIESDSEQLGELAARQDELESALEMQADLAERIAGVEDQLARLVEDMGEQEAALEALAEGLDANDTPIAILEREVQITKALNLIARARLDIGQANAGLAEQNILLAIDLLEALVETVPEGDVTRITQALERLELALTNLDDSPIIAANDLDAAWNALVSEELISETNP